MTTLPSELMEQMIREVRETYVERRRHYDSIRSGRDSNFGSDVIPRWDGGEDRESGREYKSAWESLIVKSMEHSVDPLEAINLAFDLSMGNPPTPPQCIGARVIESLKSRAHFNVPNAQLSLNSQRQLAQNSIHLRQRRALLGWSSEDILADIAMDPGLSFDPLFRYSLAATGPCTDVMRVLFRGAVNHYQRHRRVLDEVWGESLPRAIVEAADAVTCGSRRSGR